MSGVKFSELMDRADDETLRELVGQPALSVLRLFDDSSDTPSILRKTLLQICLPSDLLRDPATRQLLTAVLPAAEADRLAGELGSVAENPFTYLRNLQLRKGSQREQVLFDFFRVDTPEEPPRQTPQTSLAVPRYGLFEHQRTAVRKVRKALAESPQRVLLHMPTGSGKTRTAMNLIMEFLRSSEPGLVVWLAYSEELCAQAAEEFETGWSQLGNRDISVYRFWGDANLETEDCRDGLVVAGLAKTYARAKTDLQFLSKLSDRAGLVVIDEAHQAIAETYRFVLETLVERRVGVALLGLSATPGRTWNDPEEDRKLSQFFGRRKVSLSTPAENPMEFLIEQGYLARPEFVPIPYSGAELTAVELSKIEVELDIPESVLHKLAEDEQRNLVVVRSAEALLRKHQRILLFAATVKHAETLAVVLAARGHQANVITGTTARARRQRLIEQFKAPGGPGQILCNYGVLTTGFDAPLTSAAIIARPTKSLVLYSQMVGRATRGTKAGGNATAEIHTVIDSSLPGFGEMSQAFLNWEDVWEDQEYE